MPTAKPTTPFQSRYWAEALTLKGASGSLESISRSISNARVDLNPHQIEAALFALRSPLSRGVILADEVGLGKTVEAGIVMAQRWAERRRRILLIVPAILRRQWQAELDEKFFIPSMILESAEFRRRLAQGEPNPFDQFGQVVICSYHFASAKEHEIHQIPWDLAVIDEAHRLRNVFKPASRIARAIADALAPAPKLLLTATPLQNSLVELYGLVSVIDDHVFGDLESFKGQFVRNQNEADRNLALKERLRPVCIRTLRKQVLEYIPFRRRVAITQDFLPGDEEHELYELISTYLQRDRLIALPASQRALITLILRKLLASSTFAIAKTLDRLIARLEGIGQREGYFDDDDIEGIEEFEDEWQEAESEANKQRDDPAAATDAKLLKEELAELRRYADLAQRITVNAKGEALIPALKVAFERTQELGAERKAVIFTESRRTQKYLYDLLSSGGYDGQVVMLNGTNNDPSSKALYQKWLKTHEGGNGPTGSPTVDMKAAITEVFRREATILVATEAAAEGMNLQFCSLVVNFDLPWNPQRIEQRIGRCHRYGQKHDVVVVNFLNRRNAADLRVFQLLSQKFQLFDGVFGASDEVLGALESGVDIERRIAAVYQTCRTTEEIEAAFDKLQRELDDQIQARLAAVRQALLENFDEEVGAKLKVRRDSAAQSLSERERWLIDLTRVELGADADFEPDQPRFRYSGSLAKQGHYHLDWKEAERLGDAFYRQDCPLAQRVLESALGRELPPASVQFDYARHGAVVSVLKPLIGQSGWLELSKLSIQAFDREESLIFTGLTDNGCRLDEEVCRKLLALPATVLGGPPPEAPSSLAGHREAALSIHRKRFEERCSRFFDEEVLKLDRWSDDLKQGLEREIKDLDKAIRECRKKALLAPTLAEKLESQREMKTLESTRNRKRKELFDSQDQIDGQRDDLIQRLEKQLRRQERLDTVFAVHWNLR